MFSAVWFINQKGEIVISRYYRDDVTKETLDMFRTTVITAKNLKSPVITLGNTTFLVVRHKNLFVVGASKANVNVVLVFQFLHHLVTLFIDFFGSCDEESLKGNFTVIYELLDEALDFGYPQLSAADVLRPLIKQEGLKSEKAKQLSEQLTGAISWRRDSIKYRKNEVYLDVVESVNLLFSTNGTLLRSDVSGKVQMKVYLSGMPDCKLGLNEKLMMESHRGHRGGSQTNAHKSSARAQRRGHSGIELDDITFHQCVKLARFDSDRTISFVPPDGDFELMKYRVTDNVDMPFKVFPVIKEYGRNRVEVNLKLKSMFSIKLFASNVIVRIPTPKNTALCKCAVMTGKCKYVATENAIIWKIKRFPGDSEIRMSAEVELLMTTVEKKWSRPPITVDFLVPMFTASGLRIRFLKVVEQKLGYTPLKWVRYITKAGRYEVRI